ncbi:fumarylacetoacetate hydrolase family protein [Leucobacter luti]|uniref:2-keto-4-pentenoate hydratase/2-oxohepta-3-ene-1,7-dioic acid hydratase in catechol pathway n=1 Tax=Leucobacter luti TaxID=340320 RepID=A0A4R6S2B1_9MICO|nr:fumarylacetoacetate hydrolase family protein [Leucobacter luti]MCW2289187.1 2-keto-4-pentenoate hydratase/2-oxohepta-3-ene-1,7-dioic acid hydratase in catechol pathway [Leucobacter luti]QYM74990.1 fumarylacetoacetate hydrolase family protein [Leucobacter luti]TCK39752.1 2-keto-4-pentenoate hydratase/2-oxohepta-3-ene-1,7-dioic acid hydratase in catechol pathway [Leucobacter luti]TDP93403.1 2-keto-4-pentenoate hydratase/2-oxohepta-3-ene-1,7-dioic acid hydratase in catechol pathway [Leucobacter
MKLARFRTADGVIRLGRVDGEQITDLAAVTNGNSSLRELIPELDRRRSELLAAEGERYALASVTLEAPIDAPQKYLAIGMNYREHAAEARAAGIPTPKNQLWFNKQVSCIVGPTADIVKPDVSDALDYEIELGVVIGRECRHVSIENAYSVIAGYLVANDVSVRDWLQHRSPTFTLGKSFDTHGPIGPWLTTADEIPDPQNLRMRLTVNGEVRQDWRTDDMIYNIAAQIAELTTVMTLMPGDIIATGTPAGIGAPTGSFLRVGDVVRAEIEGLGVIENAVVGEG